MLNLDEPQVYKKYDPEGMLAHIHNIPELCQQAWQMALSFKLPPDYAEALAGNLSRVRYHAQTGDMGLAHWTSRLAPAVPEAELDRKSVV